MEGCAIEIFVLAGIKTATGTSGPVGQLRETELHTIQDQGTLPDEPLFESTGQDLEAILHCRTWSGSLSRLAPAGPAHSAPWTAPPVISLPAPAADRAAEASIATAVWPRPWETRAKSRSARSCGGHPLN